MGRERHLAPVARVMADDGTPAAADPLERSADARFAPDLPQRPDFIGESVQSDKGSAEAGDSRAKSIHRVWPEPMGRASSGDNRRAKIQIIP